MTGLEQYRVIQYRPEYRAQVIENHKYLWGPNAELRATYVDWKYVRNPYVPAPLIYLAMQGEQVVGLRSFVGANWEFGSPKQTLVLPLEADVIIAPDHRKQGLVSLIMKAALKDLAEKGYNAILSLGTVPIVLNSDIRMGWRSIGSLRPLGCTVTQRESFPRLRAFVKKSKLAVSVYRKLRNQAKESPPDKFHFLDRISDRCDAKIGDYISIGKAPRIRDMVRLKGRLQKDPRIRHVQGEEYYAWRFQNPRSNYRFLFWDDGDLQGYVVLQATAFRSKQPIGVIDWCASSDEAHAELLQAVHHLTCGETLFTWSATLTERERRIFEIAGFQTLPELSANNPWIAAVRPVRDEMLNEDWRFGDQRLLDISSWDFRMLDPRSF